MKYFYFLSVSFFFVSTCVIAQSNYKPGFIVAGNGEKINGYINYKEWNYNPDNISFKKTLNDKAQTFTSTTISYFEISGLEVYKAAHVVVSMDRTDLQGMKSELDTSSVTKDVFLKQLKKGDNVSLFSYSDQVKTRYYIYENKGGDQPKELLYHVYNDIQTSAVKSQNVYSGLLISMAKKYRPDNFEILDNMVHVKYNEKELLKAVMELNDQVQEKNTVTKGNRGTRFFGSLGLNATDLSYAGTPPQAATQNSKTSYLPKISVGFDAPFNPNVGKLLFRTEFGFAMAKGELTRKDAKPTVVTTKTLKLNQQTVSIKPQLIYNLYNTDGFKIYLGAGININYSYFPASTNKTVAVNIVPSLSSTSEERYESATSFWFQLAPKAGFTLNKKWDISVNYFVPTSLSDANSLPKIKVQGFDAGLSYFFGR